MIIIDKENKTQHKQQGNLVIFKTYHINKILNNKHKFINSHTFAQSNQVAKNNSSTIFIMSDFY